MGHGSFGKNFHRRNGNSIFPGCYLSYDRRLKKVAAATVNILNKAGVDFGILGDKENCCGESIRKTGDEELFRRLAKENIKTCIDSGVKKILVSSPIATIRLKMNIPIFKVNFEIVHITQYLFELINREGLSSPKNMPKRSLIMTRVIWVVIMASMTSLGRS